MPTSLPIPDHIALLAAQARQNRLTKPTGSLGMLEDIACRFAAWQQREIPQLPHAAITVFAADHGVTAEGVSAYPSAVTAEMVKNFAAGGAAICVLARQHNARLEVVDVGVASTLPPLGEHVVDAKVMTGTHNLAVQAAMSREQAQDALEAGRAAARRAIDAGATLLIAGDMGIGNTTASAALICHFCALPAATVVGRGTGVDDAGVQLKARVVEAALARLTQDTESLTVLAEVGGLEIAAMAGFYLEGARLGMPSLVDGFIAAAAALVAQALEPDCTLWLMASHRSQETGHLAALAHLGLIPLVDFRLRLGEGSGAALVLPLIASAILLHGEMATFDSAGVSDKA
ncbi:nicotinate-nucleotide--dimethylbenzimidazole phosphoribosyltransferase [Craterilacuibacter sinensis]|uniref:Nicotinate-nucleotide--dimethylbenzimidazole phosphoribosyltransferase n=1 Tax=Craterilacuibacter sinensis TaxID=2686017 RepID=A0A845BJL9_9NEIS|nr:nicotinate-nucleotide--dimethylbenzimidazole phosphoribosyltransferase [Craterilacuibacter sinensis]MXR36379.1 nicotinate-nucleotide--dimethylbenzimidazole phosphoribosyltransferase [Craterilacuibacter sinensis]